MSISYTTELTFVITTTNRIHLISKLITSIEKYFPTPSIIVGVQEDFLGGLQNNKDNIKYYFVGHDKGLSYTRNFLQKQVKTPFFLLLDDDFLLEENNGVNETLSLIKKRSDIDIIGGYLTDIYPTGNISRHYEHLISYRPEHKTLFLIPLSLFNKNSNKDLSKVDVVLNFAIFRNSIFKNIGWDENIKINGEHEDFYLDLKVNHSINIYYYPKLKALHTREITKNYNQVRNRTEGYNYLRKKWKIDKIVIFHEYTQNLAPPYLKENYSLSPSRFLNNNKSKLKKISFFLKKIPGFKKLKKILFQI